MKQLFACALLSLSLTAQAQWELTTAIKSRSKFAAVHMTDGQRGYALDKVMDAILRTDDGGRTWQRMTTLAISTPNALHCWDDQRAIVVGHGGSIHRTTDGFSSFTSTTSASLGALSSVAFANDQRGVIGDAAGRIHRTTDGGATWTLTTSGVGTSYTITALAMPSVDTAYAVAYGVGVLRSTDGGLTWSSTGTPSGTRAIHFNDALHGTAVGNGGSILQTADAGNTWTARTSGLTQNLLGLVVQGNVLLASGTGGRVARSTDGGLTWSATTVGTTLHVHQCIALGPTGIGFTGTDGRIFGTTDHGATWELIRAGVYHTFLNKVSFANADTGVAVGHATNGSAEDGLLRTVDGGRNWENTNSLGGLGVHLRPDGKGIQGGSGGANARTTDYFVNRQIQGAPEVAIRCAWSFGELDHLVAGGYVQGGFYRTSNGGATWQHTSIGNSSIYDLHFIDEQIGYAVGGDGQTWKSTDAGHTWALLPGILSNDQFSVFFLNEQLGWTVGAASGARTTDGGQTWTLMGDIPAYSMMVHFVNADTGYVTGNTGTTLRSTDGGATWEEVMPGIINALINDAAYVDGELVLVGRNGDCYRARVGCPTAVAPVVVADDDALCTTAEGSLQWFLDGGPISGADTPCIDAHAPGAYTVVATDGYGCASQASEAFIVTSVGLADRANGPALRLAPNPATDAVRIIGLESGAAHVTVLDLHGRTVRHQRITADAPWVDLHDMASGVLVLRVLANGTETHLRLVKP